MTANIRYHFALALLTIAVSGCALSFQLSFDALEAGSTAQEARQALGDPMEINEFSLPEGPFWGPQESLVNLIEPGSPVREWTYNKDGKTYYLWFSAQDNFSTLIDKGAYPNDVVF